MITDEQAKAFGDVCYMLGQIESTADKDWITSHCDFIVSYIKSLLFEERGDNHEDD